MGNDNRVPGSDGHSGSPRGPVSAEALRQTAEELFARHDYAQAAGLLATIPPSERTPEVRNLFRIAQGLGREVASLLAQLKGRIETRQVDELEPILERLLEIAPTNAFGKQLRETLATYRKIPRARRAYRFGAAGDLLEAEVRGVPWKLLAGIALGLALVLGGWKAWSSRAATLVVQIEAVKGRSWLAGRAGGDVPGDLVLRIGDRRFSLPGGGTQLSLPPGRYDYEVFAGAVRVLGPQRLDVDYFGANLLTLAPPFAEPVFDVASVDSAGFAQGEPIGFDDRGPPRGATDDMPVPSTESWGAEDDLPIAPTLAEDEAPPKPEGVAVGEWGTFISPLEDCRFEYKERRAKLVVGPGDHTLDIERNVMTAPRVLRPVRGNFNYQIDVSGIAYPQGDSVVSGRRPFIGAGIVVWNNRQNYIRLERAGMTMADFSQDNFASFEHRKNGEFVRMGSPRDGLLTTVHTTFLVRRIGSRIHGWASNTPAPFRYIGAIRVDWPDELQIGVVGNNGTEQELEVHLQWGEPKNVPDPPLNFQ